MMKIFKRDQNLLFEVARQKTMDLIKTLIEEDNIHIVLDKFFHIVANDPKSPMLMHVGDGVHVIFYPKNSTPYTHTYEDSVKEIEVLEGEVFEEISGKTFKKGDKAIMKPGQPMRPYTKNQECFLKVTVKKQTSIWEQIC